MEPAPGLLCGLGPPASPLWSLRLSCPKPLWRAGRVGWGTAAPPGLLLASWETPGPGALGKPPPHAVATRTWEPARGSLAPPAESHTLSLRKLFPTPSPTGRTSLSQAHRSPLLPGACTPRVQPGAVVLAADRCSRPPRQAPGGTGAEALGRPCGVREWPPALWATLRPSGQLEGLDRRRPLPGLAGDSQPISGKAHPRPPPDPDGAELMGTSCGKCGCD